MPNVYFKHILLHIKFPCPEARDGQQVRLMRDKGYSLGNIDITVIAERPKLSPHKQRILDNLYALLGSPPDTINLKVFTLPSVLLA